MGRKTSQTHSKHRVGSLADKKTQKDRDQLALEQAKDEEAKHRKRMEAYPIKRGLVVYTTDPKQAELYKKRYKQ